MMKFVLGLLGTIAGFLIGVGVRVAWPKDEARIIDALEQAVAGFWRVEFFIEDILDRTDDPQVQAEGKRALKAVLAVKRAWIQIRSRHFKQGKLFDEWRDQD